MCSYTLADEPLEHRQDSGYRVSGNITDEDGDIVASVAVENRTSYGAVDGVVSNADVDIARTPEENLAFAEESFARFYEAISSVDVESGGNRAAGHGTRRRRPLACPEQFRQAFLAGDYYTAIDTDLDDTGTLRAWALFDTEPKEEFDEYTNASISDLPAGSSLVLQESLAVNYQRLRVIFPAYGMEASVHAQDGWRGGAAGSARRHLARAVRARAKNCRGAHPARCPRTRPRGIRKLVVAETRSCNRAHLDPHPSREKPLSPI